MNASVGKWWYSCKPKKEFPFAYSVDNFFTYDVMGENCELKNEKCLIFTGILPTSSGFQSLMPRALRSLAIVTEMTEDRQGTWTFLSLAAAGMSFMSGQARRHASTLQKFPPTPSH